MIRQVLALAIFLAPIMTSRAADSDELRITTDKVIGVTRFLELNPMDPAAPGLRALMLDWEEKAPDVVNYVCQGVLDPIPSDTAPNSSELLVQFIFGSASYQVANPKDKGALVPSQLAGMRSMLKTYQAYLATDPKARIARLDDLLQKDSSGTLDEYLTPIVIEACKGPFEKGNS